MRTARDNGGASIKATVWTATAGALATAAVGWFLGVLPAIWRAIVAAAAWTWNALFFSISLPLILLVPIAALGLIGVYTVWLRAKPPTSIAVGPGQGEPPLGDLERRVLGVLARADGAWVGFDAAAEILQTPRLLLERACDELLDRRLIEADHRGSVFGSRILLTPAGRDYVIEKGYPLGQG